MLNKLDLTNNVIIRNLAYAIMSTSENIQDVITAINPKKDDIQALATYIIEKITPPRVAPTQPIEPVWPGSDFNKGMAGLLK